MSCVGLLVWQYGTIEAKVWCPTLLTRGRTIYDRLAGRLSVLFKTIQLSGGIVNGGVVVMASVAQDRRDIRTGNRRCASFGSSARTLPTQPCTGNLGPARERR